eukprot:TRINITY_DN37534_c0_g1_i3.p1 TRINITY_DN37534_c0_g1~~TRINITY_DN37534_c0_g1_i3.p1  ORF type:complete len:401 (-),score=57.40 TRINITY_DN37534_c0_g1_i3:174-1376(-)
MRETQPLWGADGLLEEPRSPAPNFLDRHDAVLNTHGPPDMIVQVRGRRLWAHMKFLRPLSEAIRKQLLEPDEFYGQQISIVSTKMRPRSVAGVKALLAAVYPLANPPPSELLPEIFDIAAEYNMHVLMNKLKLWIRQGAADASHLIAAEEHLKLETPEREDVTYINAVFDTFALFVKDDLDSLPGFSQLHEETIGEVTRRRTELMEANFPRGAKPCSSVYWDLRRLRGSLFRTSLTSSSALGRRPLVKDKEMACKDMLIMDTSILKGTQSFAPSELQERLQRSQPIRQGCGADSRSLSASATLSVVGNARSMLSTSSPLESPARRAAEAGRSRWPARAPSRRSAPAPQAARARSGRPTSATTGLTAEEGSMSETPTRRDDNAEPLRATLNETLLPAGSQP